MCTTLHVPDAEKIMPCILCRCIVYKEYDGNMDSVGDALVLFPTPIWTWDIQILPDVSYGQVALRVEFIGCRDNGEEFHRKVSLDTNNGHIFT